jgi:predicted amidophosphoribosyltransferase
MAYIYTDFEEGMTGLRRGYFCMKCGARIDIIGRFCGKCKKAMRKEASARNDRKLSQNTSE